MATYVLIRSGEHERVKERNPSKASAKALAYIYSGLIIFVATVIKLNMREQLFSFKVQVKIKLDL